MILGAVRAACCHDSTLPARAPSHRGAQVQGLVTCAGLPFVVHSARHTSCNGSAAAPCCAPAAAPSGPEASACSGAAAAPAASLPLGSPSDGTTSLAVVPDLHAVPSLAVPEVAGPSAAGPTHNKPEGKDLEVRAHSLSVHWRCLQLEGRGHARCGRRARIIAVIQCADLAAPNSLPLRVRSCSTLSWPG